MFIYKAMIRQFSVVGSSWLLGSLPWGVLFVCLLFALTACTSKKPPQIERGGEGYKVSVKSDGKEVKNFSQQLVHRVSLSRSEFDALIDDWPKGLPFNSKSEYDSRGKPSGLRITQMRSATSPHMGLQKADLVTAVGTTHTYKTRDVWQLFRQLSISREATLTLVRQGKPHKILYVLR